MRICSQCKHLRHRAKQNNLREHDLLMHVLQGTLPTSHKRLEPFRAGCRVAEPSLHHKSCRCHSILEQFGSGPGSSEADLIGVVNR